ncbi:hypothetical protein WQ54_16945 [Bacillus sp. SA1-12]|uniref:hypothetical protein n=1 Tax=Bacillus sp. SA1-12 TaxID=1455638 RepID=UPI000627419B|nr:hypothetical protein [Bacillus sp. SA1-12]KKI91060.1 hypothetical protein WQ54_16945 [Bacillus sp. SA1-12]
MKMRNGISACMMTVSLIAIQFIQPIDLAMAKQAKVEVGNVHDNEESKTLEQTGWDRSSLSFIDQEDSCSCISATIKNGGDSRAMQDEVKFEVYWSAQGNPKNGEVVYTGSIDALNPGETKELMYHLDQKSEPGNYIFKTYQRPGHPGKGELWSESISVVEKADYSEFQQPLDQFFHSSVEAGTATFTVPEGIRPLEISFSSYVYPEGTVPEEDGKPYEGQRVYDSFTDVYGPGTYTITVDIPENELWQTDLYLGCVIEELPEGGHPIEKMIDADYSWKK